MAIQRVLHIVGKMDRAGAETMLMNLYRHIDHSQIQFDFITFTDEVGDYDAEIKALGGRIIPILASHSLTRMLKLKRFFKQNPDYHIVHAHMLLNNAFHLLAAKSAGVQHRISHSHSTSNGKTNIVKKIYEQWALITNRTLATKRISCGDHAANYLFGTTKDVWLLPNAVDIQKMMTVANQSRHYIDQEFGAKGFGDKGLKIIQVGRLNEVKNHQFSLEIAEQLKKRQIDFTLYIVGQGQLAARLKQQVKDKSLCSNVKFLGLRTDITELIASADYMIMPSLHEGFPVVLVESQTVGLTALVSDQVSPEVDLGLGLVQFLPIHSAKEWVDCLLKPKDIRPNEKEITEALTLYGFSAAINAEKLTQMYLNIK
ncbi:glycosyltransferase [Psychrobacter fjordensis]|uniref:glycosyltransferase n=1 Tax=Psychrobacter fjordensis TaxID=664424 RepID=UPI001D122D5F|nr:glycosyltransferase [Psychrobacter fjordensis]